jgi:DNA-binding PadR family transcriptional regulator
MAKRGRFFAWAGESQYYVEPKRLAKLGYLHARKEPGKTTERTVYTLSDDGLEALREWAATPASFTPLKSEPLLRLLIADLVSEEVTIEGLRSLRDDIEDLSERLADTELTAKQLPHRAKYLTMVTDFMRRYFELHIELIDQLERERADAPAGKASSG